MHTRLFVIHFGSTLLLGTVTVHAPSPFLQCHVCPFLTGAQARPAYILGYIHWQPGPPLVLLREFIDSGIHYQLQLIKSKPGAYKSLVDIR